MKFNRFGFEEYQRWKECFESGISRDNNGFYEGWHIPSSSLAGPLNKTARFLSHYVKKEIQHRRNYNNGSGPNKSRLFSVNTAVLSSRDYKIRININETTSEARIYGGSYLNGTNIDAKSVNEGLKDFVGFVSRKFPHILFEMLGEEYIQIDDIVNRDMIGLLCGTLEKCANL